MGFVRLWRRIISPLYGDVCKYHPTCSAYGLRALEVHGAIRGSWLTIRRIGRCHPWSMGGVDYVPGTPEAEQWLAQVAATTSPMGPVGSAASGVKE
jgi:putative membrane protein insertion efficiency factor